MEVSISIVVSVAMEMSQRRMSVYKGHSTAFVTISLLSLCFNCQPLFFHFHRAELDAACLSYKFFALETISILSFVPR